eukprot:TRINITY_DN708_c0_g1_i1.p1 TRINITY_DN708_c0_g1~~TRINITY_DN708_c0_g1_i1.p1  ORF type:complete len:127 (+),score=34.34 TRINITY_DN708_c0_g1_i1:138-518(+)
MKTALSAREKDMQKIIDDPKNREDLVQWSRKALIDENVEFLLAVKTFKENALKGSRDIYAKFLAEDSELPINHNALVSWPPFGGHERKPKLAETPEALLFYLSPSLVFFPFCPFFSLSKLTRKERA